MFDSSYFFEVEFYLISKYFKIEGWFKMNIQRKIEELLNNNHKNLKNH